VVNPRKTVGSTTLSITATLSVDTLGVAISCGLPSLAPSAILGILVASNDGSESGKTSTDPPFLDVGDDGSAVARTSSSSRCFFFLIAKSFKDILTFGTFGGSGVEAGCGGDCAGGESKATDNSAVARDR
jgi:hypothetical protein